MLYCAITTIKHKFMEYKGLVLQSVIFAVLYTRVLSNPLFFTYMENGNTVKTAMQNGVVSDCKIGF